ncbi:MAG TPA: zf-HC2 domain-containing protein [Bryobacteraceae bacterium]|nr:zf-HC2 domain-containing protein [Bryobacteraceae bacterium]
MSCQTLRNSVDGFLDQEMSEAERTRVTDHLAVCRECAAHLAELSEMRTTLKALPVVPVPERLCTQLQVTASRERSRAAATRTLPLALHSWIATGKLAVDNLMRPLALPFAGGLLSALLLFGIIVPVLGFRPAVRNDVPTVLYTAATLVEVAPFGLGDDAPVVQLYIDAKGQATNYTVERGQVSPEMQADLDKLIFFSRFTPATWFGQPTNGKLLVSFRRVLYTVRG